MRATADSLPGDHVHKRCFYERLAILCVGPLADVLLASETLNDARLDRVETLLAMDPIILSLSEILNRPLFEIEAIDVLIAFLRAHGAFEEDDLRSISGKTACKSFQIPGVNSVQ